MSPSVCRIALPHGAAEKPSGSLLSCWSLEKKDKRNQKLSTYFSTYPKCANVNGIATFLVDVKFFGIYCEGFSSSVAFVSFCNRVTFSEACPSEWGGGPFKSSSNILGHLLGFELFSIGADCEANLRYQPIVSMDDQTIVGTSFQSSSR